MYPINSRPFIAIMMCISMSGKNDEIPLAPMNGLPTRICSTLATVDIENLTRCNGRGLEATFDNPYKVRTKGG